MLTAISIASAIMLTAISIVSFKGIQVNKLITSYDTNNLLENDMLLISVTNYNVSLLA